MHLERVSRKKVFLRKIKNPASEIPLPGFEIFFDEFLAERKEELKLLKSALISSDFDVLMKMGHKWKGFSAPYGFQELAELSVKLEAASQEADSLLCSELVNEIDAYLGHD